ncbi:hypothetical protein [Endozoicomonas sp. Mp262]|uniref:hypothetical protein n=1 Tax=Endozoicomonas sp. Mp262 TaxID=2919499 RepID=UPI0021D8DAB9
MLCYFKKNKENKTVYHLCKKLKEKDLKKYRLFIGDLSVFTEKVPCPISRDGFTPSDIANDIIVVADVNSKRVKRQPANTGGRANKVHSEFSFYSGVYLFLATLLGSGVDLVRGCGRSFFTSTPTPPAVEIAEGERVVQACSPVLSDQCVQPPPQCLPCSPQFIPCPQQCPPCPVPQPCPPCPAAQSCPAAVAIYEGEVATFYTWVLWFDKLFWHWPSYSYSCLGGMLRYCGLSETFTSITPISVETVMLGLFIVGTGAVVYYCYYKKKEGTEVTTSIKRVERSPSVLNTGNAQRTYKHLRK